MDAVRLASGRRSVVASPIRVPQNGSDYARVCMPSERHRHRFATTRWTLVLRAGNGSAESERALAELCSMYWYPAYAFVRRAGHSSDQARDLTQAFFTRVLEKHYFRDAHPERGRFRSFLMASLRHFLSNERDWQRAVKRGGEFHHVSLEIEAGERRYSLEPPDPETPEHIYERRWALAVLDEAMTRLQRRQTDAGRGKLFVRLKPTLTGDLDESYQDLAQEIGMSEGALRVAIHRLRREFGSVLRAIIAETVERPEDVDDELRHLIAVVSRRG